MRRISLGSSWPSVSRGAGLDVLALGDEELLAARNLDDQVFLAVVTGDDDLTGARVFVVDVDAAGGLVHLRLDLRATGLEEFLDTGQTLRNIRSGGGATGVERTHRQLRAGLTNRLGGDNTDGLADVDLLAGGQRATVAGRTGANLRLTGEDGTADDLRNAGCDELGELVVTQVGARGHDDLSGLVHRVTGEVTA